ncbi:MAG TPA: thiolase domain-containing protein [Thermoplasmata archaeon]|nr:thiolase domain-containing protein [Thermoplasmata archaeon]
MREVAVIGVGMTKFGEMWNKSLRDLFTEAGMKALINANVSGSKINAMYVGSMSAGRFVGQEHIAPLVVDYAGLAETHIPATRIESACASGGIAFREACMTVASGMYDLVVAGGVEKMTDISGGEATETLATAADQEWEGFFGMTFPGLYALIATRHMHKYGTTPDQLAEVAVKNHANGCLNPNAHFRRKITAEQVLEATRVADPLGLLDCSPISDGAAAAVICPLKDAHKFVEKPIRVLASGQGTDTLALHERADICTMEATRYAAKAAFAQAGIKPKDVDLAEVHDCFTIAEITAIEDLGFVEKGKGGKATEDGMTRLDGEIPINTSGGLKAKGHPVGATGIGQVVELVEQLRGEAGKRQVSGAKRALAHNIGGSGASCVVHILEVPE